MDKHIHAKLQPLQEELCLIQHCWYLNLMWWNCINLLKLDLANPICQPQLLHSLSITFLTESKCDKDRKKKEIETVGCNSVQSTRREMLPAPLGAQAGCCKHPAEAFIYQFTLSLCP